jgi:hypothetical protein
MMNIIMNLIVNALKERFLFKFLKLNFVNSYAIYESIKFYTNFIIYL